MMQGAKERHNKPRRLRNEKNGKGKTKATLHTLILDTSPLSLTKTRLILITQTWRARLYRRHLYDFSLISFVYRGWHNLSLFPFTVCWIIFLLGKGYGG